MARRHVQYVTKRVFRHPYRQRGLSTFTASNQTVPCTSKTRWLSWRTSKTIQLKKKHVTPIVERHSDTASARFPFTVPINSPLGNTKPLIFCYRLHPLKRRTTPTPSSSHLTSPLNKHDPAPSTAFATAGPSPPSLANKGVIPLFSIWHNKVSTSGLKPERPFMRDTTRANIAARAAVSERAESDVTSAPLELWSRQGTATKGSKTGVVIETDIVAHARDVQRARHHRRHRLLRVYQETPT